MSTRKARITSQSHVSGMFDHGSSKPHRAENLRDSLQITGAFFVLAVVALAIAGFAALVVPDAGADEQDPLGLHEHGGR